MSEHHKTLSDETLCAYMDGELPAAEADRVTERLAADADLLERLARLRGADEQVRQAFAEVDRSPMPQAVLDLLNQPADVAAGAADHADDAASDNVVRLPQAAWRQALPRFIQTPVAIAASVALVIGWFIGGQFHQASVAVDSTRPGLAGTLALSPGLHDLLEHHASAESASLDAAASGEVQLTFRDRQGDYCRQARLQGSGRSSLIVACRRDGDWQVDWLSSNRPLAPNPDSPYQPASDNNLPALTAWISERMGDQAPLDADAEQNLIDNGWQQP